MGASGDGDLLRRSPGRRRGARADRLPARRGLRAADVLEEIGYRPGEAYARLRAAKQLVEEGRRAEADVELQHSLAFWREVDATRYVREGEALLAASA